MNPEQTKEFYKMNFPFVLKQAEKLLKHEPGEVVEIALEEFEQYQDVLGEKNKNPQCFEKWVKYKKNEHRSMELAERLRDLTGKKRSMIREKGN